MLDISEKSESVNSYDKISFETGINNLKYQNNGDGPEISYHFRELSQLTSQQVDINQPKIAQNVDSVEKSINETEHKKNMEDKSSLKDECSNKTFLVSFCNLTILDVLKNIQSSVNKLKNSNFTDKNQISMHIEELNSSKVTNAYLKNFKSTTLTKNSSYDTEIQRLQMLLLYVLEQLTHLNGSLIDTQLHLEKLLMLKQEDDAENNTINDCNYIKSNNESYKISNKHSEGEDDIFSVEELSWDEHKLSVQKLEEVNTLERMLDCQKNLNFEHTKSMIYQINQTDLPAKIICSTDKNHDENIEEISVKTNPQPASSQLNEQVHIVKSLDQEKEKSNSFQEIKNKFENLKISPILTNKNDIPVSPSFISDKGMLTSKTSSTNLFNTKSFKDDQEILSKKCEDDYVDNSAFLVSSIDSYTESISFTNPNNNNNRFSDQYKTNVSNNNDNKTINPSVAIDLVAENLSITTYLSKDMYGSDQDNKVDHYIEVVNNTNIPNQPVYVDSPCVNYSGNKNPSKSSTSSSEHIIAMRKLETKLDQVIKKKTEPEKEYSAVTLLIKELVDSEKNYVNGLFIYSQVLYNKVKLSNIISHRNLNIIFPNCIHRIYKFHADFLNQLNNIFQKSLKFELNKNSNCALKQNYEENKMQTVKFGQMFLENLESDNWKFFALYRQFYWKSQPAIILFNKLKRNSPKFERFIKILKHSEHCNHLELSSFIVIPLHRLSKYLAILRRILGYLTATQIDEKIPIVAAEHLLAGFISEMDASQNNFGSIKNNSKTLDSSTDFSNKSLKLNALYDLPIKDSVAKSQDYERKSDKHKIVNFGNVKKFWTQSTPINGVNTDSCQILNSDTQCASISVEGQSCKERLRSFNSLEKITHLDLRDISEEGKVNCKLKVIEICKDSKSLEENKSSLKPLLKEEKVENSNIVLHRPRSVPLHSKLKNPKQSAGSNENHFDTESILSQATEECSVCIHSQDECEIDTSIEDDKTCIGTNIENNMKIKENHNSDKLIAHTAPSLQNPGKCVITEFTSNDNAKDDVFKCSSQSDKNKGNSIKGFLTDQMKFFMLNNLLMSESYSIIYRKVDNIVLILCHVVFETMIQMCDNSNTKMVPCDLRRGEILRKAPEAQSEVFKYHCNNKKVQSDILEELANNLEKKENKKFSIKQLFSLRRKSRNERSPHQEHLNKATTAIPTDKRSYSRSSVQRISLEK